MVLLVVPRLILMLVLMPRRRAMFMWLLRLRSVSASRSFTSSFPVRTITFTTMAIIGSERVSSFHVQGL